MLVTIRSVELPIFKSQDARPHQHDKCRRAQADRRWIFLNDYSTATCNKQSFGLSNQHHAGPAISATQAHVGAQPHDDGMLCGDGSWYRHTFRERTSWPVCRANTAFSCTAGGLPWHAPSNAPFHGQVMPLQLKTRAQERLTNVGRPASGLRLCISRQTRLTTGHKT